MEADTKPVTQVNASTKPRVQRAISLFKAQGMLSNFLNVFSAKVRRISSDTASKECRELTGVHSSMAFLKLGLPVKKNLPCTGRVFQE